MRLFSFLLAVLISQGLRAQTCDSAIIIYHTNHDQFVPVSFAGVETDSIKNGVIVSKNYSGGSRTRLDYDSLQRLIAILFGSSSNYYDSAVYTYDSLNLIATTYYYWNGLSWNYKWDTSRVEYYYSGLRLDSVIKFFWNGANHIPFYKKLRYYTPSDTLYRMQAEVFDTATGNWSMDTLTVVTYTPTRVDSLFANGVYASVPHAVHTFDYLERIIQIDDYAWGMPDGYQMFGYQCGQLASYSRSYWGSHNAYNYWVEFDSSCRIKKVTAGSYHLVGSNSENQYDYYYVDCSTLIARASEDVYMCMGDTTTISVMYFGGNGPFHVQWNHSNSLSNDTALICQAFPDSTTDYIVTITDTNGLVAIDTVRVNVATRPDANIYISSLDTLSTCQSAILHTDTLSNVLFSWREAGSPISLGSGTNLSITQNGSYIVIAQENNNHYWQVSCPTAIDTFDFHLFSRPAPVVSVSMQCNHIVATSPTGVEFEWYRNSQQIADSTDSTFYPSQSGFYTAIAIDSGGCPSPMSTYGASYQVPTAPLTLNPVIVHPSCDTCSDGMIYPNASGGVSSYKYYLNGVRLIYSFEDSLPSGYFVLCATDQNNCTVCDSNTLVHVTAPGELLSIVVYPNPFEDELNFIIPENVVISNGRLSVYDITGRKVDDILFTGNRFTYKPRFTGKGVYYFVIHNEKKTYTRGKLVAQ